MCGIYATNIKVKDVRSKLESINFRGPDNIGIKTINDITLGHLRLSILDLEDRSNQPMKIEHYYITFNGEIYNYREVKSELINFGYKFNTESDTEVLLLGFKHWGEEVLSKLNGMFAFSIYDSINQIIFSARDRLGVKPFYYYWKEGEFEICSQIRPLIDKSSIINIKAINIYLDCGYIPSPFSIIEDVYKLPPGSALKIDLKTKSKIIYKYWDLKKVITKNISYQDAKDKLHNLLKDAVKIRLQSDVPFGSFLSGGIDSALVSSIASRVSKSKINTYSVGFENKNYDESEIAQQYSKIIGTNHKTIKCGIDDILNQTSKHQEVYDEPFADSSALPSLLLNKVTKENVTVALSGDGGDESFMGYNYFLFINKHSYIFKIPQNIRLFIIKSGLLSLIRKISGKNIPDKLFKTKNIEEYIFEHFTGYDSLQLQRDTSWYKYYKDFKIMSKDSLQKAADLNIKLWLENDSNVKVDRASMAYSVEVRSPLLDYRIIEFARSLPISYRYRKGVRKRILRDILKEYIPEKVFNQPKKGFGVPLGNWIRNELREDFEKTLDNKFLSVVPNLDVKKFNKRFRAHMNGEADYKTDVWKLYVLRKWYEEFGFYPKDN